VVLSRPLLGERPTRSRWIAATVGFVGILIMLRPGSAVFHPAVLLLIGAAVCSSLYQILTRKLIGDDSRTTLFYSALVGTVCLTLVLPWGLDREVLSLHEGGLLVLLGLLAGLGHWSVIGAYNLAPASLLGPFAYLQMIWATAYGYVIFHQLPDRWSALGMVVLVASGVALALQERRRSRL